jgi:hypothetical protein
MPAPLVTRLLEQLGRCSDAEEAAECRAVLGSYYARVGLFDQAEEIRAELRREFYDGRSLRVTVRLMCLDALLLYFRDLSPSSRERVAGAHVLAKASRAKSLIALTSSWLAHIDFNLNRYSSMADALVECSSVAGPDDQEASCRAALVWGDAYMFVGDRAIARRWYERARQLAVAIGDQASIGALTYNPAALSVALLRLAELQDPIRDSDRTMVATEVRSAINYQLVAGLSSLDHLLHTARVGVLILEGKHSEAATLAREVLAREQVPVNTAQEYLLKADLAAACARTGEAGDACNFIEAVPLERVYRCEPDDRALILARLADAYAALEKQDAAHNLREASLTSLREHSDRVADVRAILGRCIQASLTALPKAHTGSGTH